MVRSLLQKSHKSGQLRVAGHKACCNYVEMDTRTKQSTIFAVVFILGTFIYIKCYHQASLFLTSGAPVARNKFSENVPATAKEIARQEYLRASFEASEKNYQSFVEKRRKLVGRKPESVKPWNGVFFWEYFIPTFFCPYLLQRIGRFGDGGKWTCGFELFEKDATANNAFISSPQTNSSRPCIVYSFGVAGESSFEAEFLKRTDCEIFAYDASVNKPGPEVSENDPRFHFHKMYIDDENTLAKMMKENNHTWIDFLKMDIEAAEFGALSQIMDDFENLPFGHLNLEVHVEQFPVKKSFFPEVYKLWERLEEKGLRPFKNEVNHNPCVHSREKPTVVEYAFINILGPSRLLP